ncbi:hypothetical protein Ahy_B02g058557 isoform B [Arachis hypogaea]|uniref:CCHC-type domain-containing protein n=1 Tax=Arachis hypogaea TaxID=3818 RepID=A0A445AEV5_ARAHY|nr:hypothetical protein Ahy_B02g058557 isoform B [Arachis hypogaea]
MTRFLNEMDTCMLRRPRRCKQCGAEGHSRSRCRQSVGLSAGPAEDRHELPYTVIYTSVPGIVNPN